MSDAIRQWVESETGLTTIWLHPNAPRPDRPYAGLQILNVSRLGDPVRGDVNEDGESELQMERELTVSVNIHESSDNADPRSALETATDLRDSLDALSVLEPLRAGGFAFRGVELLADTPTALETSWEPRATFDVRFGTTKTRIDDLGVVEKVVFDGTVEDIEFEFIAQTED